MWLSLMLLIMVAFDLSALVRYITRFTEESFAMLIAIIFIFEALNKQYRTIQRKPVNFHPDDPIVSTCMCNWTSAAQAVGTYGSYCKFTMLHKRAYRRVIISLSKALSP